LVAIRVGDEEEARQRPAVMLEVAQRPGREILARESRMFGVDIIDDDSKMAVAVAQRIGLLAIEIDGQFDLERRGGMAQIDQREIRKLEMVGNLKPEGACVEVQRLRLVEHADHRVNGFSHSVELLEI